MKHALLIVSFGSTVPAAQLTLAAVADVLRSATHRDCCHVYSSTFIRRKLGNMESPQEAIERLISEGYADIFVQPTHLIPGVEYDRLKELVRNYDCVRLGRPLIDDAEWLTRAAAALLTACPTEKALLLMGHGTDHLANFIFPALQTALRVLGKESSYVATVEGWPTLDDAIGQLHRNEEHSILLQPFLLTAGDHVVNDMLGEGGWKARLEQAGFDVECRPVGLGDLSPIRDLYREKLSEGLSET